LRFLLSDYKKRPMTTRQQLFAVFTICSLALIPSVHAAPTVEIIMDQTDYKYCEKLFYTIQVSEVTGDPAIIHIRDQSGKGSSAIPIPISNKQTPIPSMIPFEAEIFPVGKYFIDVEYSGAKDTAVFDLSDSGNACIPSMMKQIAFSWTDSKLSDGFFIDAINKFVDKQIIKIPDTIKEKSLDDIHIPSWVKNTVTWWLDDSISDDELANAFQYLIDKNIIKI